MTIDFTLSPELEEIRSRSKLHRTEMKPVEETIERDKLDQTDRDQYISLLVGMRKGLLEGLASTHAKGLGRNGSRACQVAMVMKQLSRITDLGSSTVDSDGNGTLLHWGTDEQLDDTSNLFAKDGLPHASL